MGGGSAPASSGGSGAGPRGPSSPGATAAGPSGARGGIALDFRRGKTAKKLLEVDWTYPVWKPVDEGSTPKPGQTTAAVEVEHALPLKQAYELITDGDRRPLLVLRECERCKGTDHALLSRSLDNEQTVMMTKWFRCVKLPTNVLTKSHPLFNLFLREKEGERIPHLFFADPDGSNKAELPGDQSQLQLWETMFSYLERCYEGDAKHSIKELRQVLSQYDKIDGLEQEVKTRIDKEIEKKGPESPKIKELEAKLAKLGKERDELKAKETALRSLALKTLNAPAPTVPAAAK
jgi:hypothetical protein